MVNIINAIARPIWWGRIAFLFFGAYLLTPTAVQADTTWVSGQLGGEWTAEGTPYMITDSCWVDPNIGLVVGPGVAILFSSAQSQLWLSGTCNFNGTDTDSVKISLDIIGSQFRSRSVDTDKIQFRHVNIFSLGVFSLFGDSVSILNTTYRSTEMANQQLTVNAHYAEIIDADVYDFRSRSDSTVLRRICTTWGIDIEDGSLFADSVFAIGEYAESYSRIFLLPLGDNRTYRVSNSSFGSLTVNAAPHNNCTLSISTTRVTSHVGNCIRIVYFPFVEINDCALQRVRLEQSGGRILRSSLYSLAIEDIQGTLSVYNNTFDIHEASHDLYPHGFVTGTVEDDFHLFNNIFWAGDSGLTVIHYPIAAPVDATFNIASGMTDPWREIHEGCCNFSASNLFDPHSETFGLRYGSAAIDNGRLGFPDGDGTRSDIGMDWWDQRYDHPPTIVTPATYETRWGDPFTFVLSAVDEGPVHFPFVPTGPRWLTGPGRLDEARDTLFAGTIPFGANSFDITIGGRDQLGQIDREHVHVEIYPQSVLLDTVRGVLTAEHSPYRFFRDITIPRRDTLYIEPGVVIRAESLTFSPTINVRGALIALGTQTDSIRFESIGGRMWQGIASDSGSTLVCDYVSIIGTRQAIEAFSPDSVSICNATIERLDHLSTRSVYVDNSFKEVKVSNANFINGAQLGLSGCAFTLNNSKFSGGDDMSSSGTVYINESTGIVRACEFANGTTPALQIQSSDPLIERCVFHDTFAPRTIVAGTHGMSGPIIRHNTFISSGTPIAIDFSTHSTIVLTNNIFVNYQTVLRLVPADGDTNDLSLTNNCFWNVGSIVNQENLFWPTVGELTDVNVNGDSIDFYANLRSDPAFEENSFFLQGVSPCIDAGLEFGQEFSGQSPDIGAFEYVLDTPYSLKSASAPTAYLLTTYPNPFNSTTEITFDIPRASHAMLKIYDVLGREVQTLLDNDVHSGSHTVMWNAEEMTSGIYFVRLQAGDGVMTKKVALVR